MKKIFYLVALFSCCSLLSAAQALHTYPRSNERRILTDRATMATEVFLMPHGALPTPASYVADSLKNYMFWVNTADNKLYKYNNTSHTWELVGGGGGGTTTAYVDSVALAKADSVKGTISSPTYNFSDGLIDDGFGDISLAGKITSDHLLDIGTHFFKIASTVNPATGKGVSLKVDTATGLVFGHTNSVSFSQFENGSLNVSGGAWNISNVSFGSGHNGTTGIFYSEFSGGGHEIGMMMYDDAYTQGIFYHADYHVNGIANKGNRWIPDAGWVNAQIAAAGGGTTYSAGLGLNLTGTVFKLDTAATHGAASKDFVFAAFNTKAQDAATYQPIGTYLTPSSTNTLTNKSGNISQWTNDSGYITGNQSISFAPTGDVTGSTTGSTSLAPALTIGAGKVTNTMLAGSIASSKLVGSDIVTIGTLVAGSIPYSLVTGGPSAISGTGYSKFSGSTPSFITAIPNADLANSTISGIALGSNLNSLTATDGSLTFSGSYNGSTGRTAGLNFANGNVFTTVQTVSLTGIGVTTTDGLLLSNPDAATSGNAKKSPGLHNKAFGYASTPAASRAVEMWQDMLTVQGTTNPSGMYTWYSGINGAGPTAIADLSTAGTFRAYNGVISFGTIEGNNLLADGAINAIGNDFYSGSSSGNNSGTTAANPAYMPASASGMNFRTLFGGTSTMAVVAGNYAGNVYAASPANLSTAVSGTNPVFFNLGVGGYSITNNGATVTDATSFYIDAPPTGTAGQLTSLYIKTGTAKFGGPVQLKGYTVSTLPTGVTGMTAYVTDASSPVYGSTVAGSGSTFTHVIYNGSNWIVD